MVVAAPPIVDPSRMGSKYGLSVATANPNSFFACSSLTEKPFFRARATVIAGSELLWQETQPRLLKTASPLISIKGRIFLTAVRASGDPAAGLGHSSLTSFAPALTRSCRVDGDPMRDANR